jgi:hypothetical protein
MSHLTQRSKSDYVWYVGYGSNILEERFTCYIEGGQFRLGGKPLTGCRDKSPPVGAEKILVPHEMYFAGNSRWWKGGGTALLDSTPTDRESEFARGRIWKITTEQFQEVWAQEGKGTHDFKISLGLHADGCEIVAFTSTRKLSSSRPSADYIQTVALGLRETFAMNSEQVIDYLCGLEGIVDLMPKGELEAIVRSLGM